MGQLLFGDANGDSVIVEGDNILPGQESYQVATNFRLSEHSDPPYPCVRYTAAQEILSEADAYSVDLFRDVLEATHQEGDAPTVYSNVYDLRNGLIYLYYHHDFENPVVIDVAAELAQGFHYTRLATLFPSNAAAAEHEAQFEETFAAQFEGRVSPIEPDRLFDYVGEYRLAETGEQVNVAVDEGKLFVQATASLPIELLHESEDDFFRVFGDGSELIFTFQRDGQGIVDGAAAALGDETFTLERTGPGEVTTTTAATTAPAAAPEPAADGSDVGLLWWGVIVVALGAVALVGFRLVKSR